MTFLASLVIVVGFILLVTGVTYGLVTLVSRRENQTAPADVPPVGVPPTTLGRDTPQQHTFGPINQSIWGGLILMFFVAVLLTVILGLPLRLVSLHFFWTRFTVSLLLAGYYFYLSLVEVPYGFRGMTLVLGARFPFLCSRRGLPEGLNFVPLGIVQKVDVDVREKRIKFMENVESYTKDRVLATVRAFLQRTVTDVFEFQGVVEADNSLSGLALQAARTVVKQYTSKEIVQKGKDELSLEIEEELDRLVTEDGENPEAFNWGLEVLHVVVEEIRIPPTIETAWAETTRQEALGDAENLEANRRAEQVRTLTGHGVSPDGALAASLINAGKTGATISSINFHGLGEVGEGLEHIGDGILRFAERFGGRTPNGGNR